MAMNAAILCPGVCISDITNKARMCGNSAPCITTNHFLFFICKTRTIMAAPKQELKFKAKKVLLLHKY